MPEADSTVGLGLGLELVASLKSPVQTQVDDSYINFVKRTKTKGLKKGILLYIWNVAMLQNSHVYG